MERGSSSARKTDTINLYLLGGFRAERDGQELPADVWPRRAARTLIKVLATTAGHRLHRDQLTELLWPDRDAQAADAALRKALHHARHTLEPELASRAPSRFLITRDDVIYFAPSGVWIDADAFQTAAEAALVAGETGALDQAAALYTGELLPEDRYDDWATERRLALADLQTRLLLRLADADIHMGNARAAIARYRRLLEMDPAHEGAHRGLMRLYASEGHRHDALRQYQACRTALAAALDAEPDPETEQLYQELLSGREPVTGSAPAVATVRQIPGAAQRQAAGRLIGRDDAFGTVMETLRRTASGQGGTLLLAGEAGIGKSRLAAEAARRAHNGGWLTLWGTALEQERQLPFGALVDALDPVVRQQEPAERERLASRFPIVAKLMPSLTALAGGGPLPSAGSAHAERMRLFSAVVAIFDHLRGDHPLLFVLDDLHAADASVLQVFYYLARRAGDRPWLLVGTYRPSDVVPSGELSRLLTAIDRERLGRELHLPRLDQDETHRQMTSLLASGICPSDLVDQVFAHSLGNPLFTQQLVQAMRAQGILELHDGQWAVPAEHAFRVPARVRDLIDSRIDRLGAEVRQALGLVAVAGTASPFRLLRDAGTLDPAPLLDALDRALTANLLEERGDGYGFPHPLVRLTVYEGLSRSRRTLLHAALARAIERQAEDGSAARPSVSEALAYHWTEAGEPGRAVPYLLAAADRAAAVYANDEAIAHLRQALTLLDDVGSMPATHSFNRVTVLERLGDLLALTGAAGPAHDAYVAAIAGSDGAPLDTARLRRKCGHQALLTRDRGAAEALLDAADAGLDLAQPGPDTLVERARIKAVRAQNDFLAFRFQDALAAGEESLRLAEAAHSPADIGHACEMVAMACLPLGDWRRGIAFERRTDELSDFNRLVRDASDIHLCLSEYHLYGDAPMVAARAFLRASDEALRMGATRSLALCHYYLGNMAYFRGRFAEALQRLTQAIQLYRQVESPSGEAIAVMMRGVTLTALGRLDEARQGMEAGLDAAAHGTLRSHALIRMYAGLGRNRLDANDAVGARDYAERALNLAEEPSDCICYAAVHPVATAAFALTGDLDRAAIMGERALAQARAINSPPLLCMAQQANAMVMGMTGEWGPAFAALDDGQRLAESYTLPYELARTLLMRSFVHMQRHAPRDLAAAGVLTTEASAMLLRLGVRASAAQARSSLGFMRSQIGR